MKKLALIIPYFGALPPYFPLWVKTCANNSDIDFLVFTDQKIEIELPSNCRIITYSLIQFKEKIQEILGFEVNLNTPYKLCDFKPTYGLVFYKYLLGYAYWGYCDIDIIWGDFKLLEKIRYYRYDKIFERGHLTILKNNNKCNNLFKKRGGVKYNTVFTSPEIYCFDEFYGMNIKGLRPFIKCFFKIWNADIIPDGWAFCGKERFPSNYKLVASGIKNYKNQVFYYESGKVYQAYISKKGKVGCRELLYLHFQKREFYDWFIPINSERFYILSNYFIDKKNSGIPSKEELMSLLPEIDTEKEEILASKSYKYLYKNNNWFKGTKLFRLIKYMLKTRKQVEKLNRERK